MNKIKDRNFRVKDLKGTVMTKILINYLSLIDVNSFFIVVLNTNLSKIFTKSDQDSAIDCLVQRYFGIEYYLPRRLLFTILHPFITILLLLLVYTIYRIVAKI